MSRQQEKIQLLITEFSDKDDALKRKTNPQ